MTQNNRESTQGNAHADNLAHETSPPENMGSNSAETHEQTEYNELDALTSYDQFTQSPKTKIPTRESLRPKTLSKRWSAWFRDQKEKLNSKPTERVSLKYRPTVDPAESEPGHSEASSSSAEASQAAQSASISSSFAGSSQSSSPQAAKPKKDEVNNSATRRTEDEPVPSAPTADQDQLIEHYVDSYKDKISQDALDLEATIVTDISLAQLMDQQRQLEDASALEDLGEELQAQLDEEEELAKSDAPQTSKVRKSSTQQPGSGLVQRLKQQVQRRLTPDQPSQQAEAQPVIPPPGPAKGSSHSRRGQAQQGSEALVSDQGSFNQGAMWLTVGNIFSRILGAIYVIPWAAWLGAEYMTANTLYSVGYKPYSLFLAIATAGFPSAIAKQMAYYHSKQEYRAADRLFKYSAVVMALTGFVSAALLYILAPTLAYQSPTDVPEAATLVIRSLVPALLILPMMSLLRGYFQGFNDMKPTAVSQILEQIARVVYMLAATYAIMQIYLGTVTQAVVHSTFAAFIGAAVSMLYLVFKYLRYLPMIQALKNQSLNRVHLDIKRSLKIMLQDSVPFILLGSGIIFAQLIDTYTFSQILRWTSSLLLSEISEMYGSLSLDVDKLMMIVISLAVSIATSAVPLVTRRFAVRDIQGTTDLVSHIIKLFSFVLLPASLGMGSVSKNVYQFFYPQGHPWGPSLLVLGSLTCISLGTYTIFSTVLQSMNFRRVAIRFLMVGLLVKLILQFPMVWLFYSYGALGATGIAFLVTSILMWNKLKRELNFDIVALLKDLIPIVVGSAVMAMTTFMWGMMLDSLFGPVGRLLTFVKLVLIVVIGILLYGGMMAATGKLEILLGDRYREWQDKLRIM